MDAPITRTLEPINTGTSVVGITYKDGVLIASDTLVSYGSLSRFRSIQRLVSIGPCLIGASGDYSDFQHITDLLTQKVDEASFHQDGFQYTAPELFEYLCRVMYERRSKVNPYWNRVVMAGSKQGKPFLGCVDLYGTHYASPTVATGYGEQLAQPILRKEWHPDMSLEEAHALLEKCMRVLLYRDCYTINKVQFARIGLDGQTTIEPPAPLTGTRWEAPLTITLP
ncbi:putative Proteasome subunit beta type-4 [Paratrimastix pyriformis]|uniref:Proteasome subunit beta n=1 Tax=Paratrimastix pyriformis TaxID=342808 RepID=A0ABQ8UJX6_9EUKA|nr:putative Proteasome subunit beta type-4 [Paratrimastix pyriformis]